MNKAFALIPLLLALGWRGYLVYQQHQSGQLHAGAQTIQQVKAMSQHMQASGREAEQTAAPVPTTAAAPAHPPAPGTPEAAARQEIEGALKTMHVTTIMPGQPGIVIIDKKEYAEGDALPLGKGRKAQVTAVQDDGVLLTCNGQTFHLDPPAAPDLAATRKGH